jgi:uncharacterized membrane protein YkvA (DUF1232 family)
MPHRRRCGAVIEHRTRRPVKASAGLAVGPANRYLLKMTEASQDFMNLPVATAPPEPDRFWRKLRRALARIPFAEDLVAAWYCTLDRDTPPHVRAVLAGALAYFMLPADLIPDVMAGLGFTDDASVLAAAIVAVGRHILPRHRRRARTALDRLAR